MSEAHATLREEFRDAMCRLGAAVNVITTDGPAGRHGMIASAVCSVSDDPPTILVCVNRRAHANALLKANRRLCVNILALDQKAVCTIFMQGGSPIAERFERSGEWSVRAAGSPRLANALATVDTRVTQAIEIGSHTVFFCEVIEIGLGEPRTGLVYFDRDYRHTADLPVEAC